jgi:hypothetical protein
MVRLRSRVRSPKTALNRYEIEPGRVWETVVSHFMMGRGWERVETLSQEPDRASELPEDGSE